MTSIIIHRDSQDYGPFSVEDLRGFLASGNAVPTDFARLADQSTWSTIEQILDTQLPPLPNVPPLVSPIEPPQVSGPKAKPSGSDTLPFILSLVSLTGCLSFLALPAVVLAHRQRAKGVRTRKTVATLAIGYCVLSVTLLAVILAAMFPPPPTEMSTSSEQSQSGPATPSSLLVTEYDSNNPSPEGMGNMHGDTAFKTLEDAKAFFADVKQMSGGSNPTLYQQVSNLDQLEDSYLTSGRAVRVAPGSHQITGVFDHEGQKATLIDKNGMLVSASDGLVPCFKIKDGDETYYMSWSFTPDLPSQAATDAPAKEAPAQKSSAPAQDTSHPAHALTREEFKSKLPGYFLNGLTQLSKAKLIEAVGNPDRIETLNGQTVWRYLCLDGEVDLVGVTMIGPWVNIVSESDY